MYNSMNIVRNAINQIDALNTYDEIDNRIFADTVKKLKEKHNQEIINLYTDIKPYDSSSDRVCDEYYSYNKNNYKKRWKDYYNSKSRDRLRVLN